MIKIGKHRITTKIKRYYPEDTMVEDPNNVMKRIPHKYYIIIEFLHSNSDDNEQIEFDDKQERDKMLELLDEHLIVFNNGEQTKPRIEEALQYIRQAIKHIGR